MDGGVVGAGNGCLPGAAGPQAHRYRAGPCRSIGKAVCAPCRSVGPSGPAAGSAWGEDRQGPRVALDS